MAGHIADSSSIDWCSPLWVTEGAHAVLGTIGVDPCGNPGSRLRVRAEQSLMLPESDGLKLAWHELQAIGHKITSFYVNSPFGTIYTHNVTKAILLPKQLRAIMDACAVDPLEPTREEKRRQKAIRDQYECTSIADWVEKCSLEAKAGMQGIQLGPANVDTSAWHDFIEETANAILYIRGRVYFELVDFVTLEVIATGPAPMPCALTYWGPDPDLFARTFADRGHVHILR